jgi:hypothetical protein
MSRSEAIDAGFDKLQDFLLAMTPGDQVSVERAAEISGLDTGRCNAVLSALLRAGLMRQQQDAFVRCRLHSVDQQTV